MEAECRKVIVCEQVSQGPDKGDKVNRNSSPSNSAAISTDAEYSLALSAFWHFIQHPRWRQPNTQQRTKTTEHLQDYSILHSPFQYYNELVMKLSSASAALHSDEADWCYPAVVVDMQGITLTTQKWIPTVRDYCSVIRSVVIEDGDSH